jgi:hypothetical protein
MIASIMKKLLLVALIWLGYSAVGIATEFHYEKAWRVGVTSAQFIKQPFEQTDQLGHGMVGRYEFILKQRFHLGIQMSYRHFTGETTAGQMVYGLIMQHNLSDASHEEGNFYVSYGLLMQVVRLKDMEGAGTAHDTRSALGYNFMSGSTKTFIEVAHNFSRLRYFSTEQIWLDHIDLTFGVYLPK